ncbi:hypothetical protein [Catenovulum maritimum]|uniref:Uncharacterized protein n=1 Tax=Catenovulum maritimum TaxID=1513271 RepID=A0A0J8GWX8_9ALTE|nr:hypothetical protein [Catenovulum maritimum]KMT65198.1 hypothetical protein XM47_10725 [Catenovulum maritimum]
MRLIQLGIVLLSLFSSIIHANEQVPCWLNKPINDHLIGFIGVSSPYAAKADLPLTSSRKKALSKMAAYFDWTLIESDFENLKQNTKALSNGAEIIFAKGFQNQNGFFSYVTFQDNRHRTQQKSLNKLCKLSVCQFEKCQPDWLCKSNASAVFGASNLTSIPSRQYLKTAENAREIMSYLDQAYVDEYIYKVNTTGLKQNVDFRLRNWNVDKLGTSNSKLLNTNVCHSRHFLFSRFTHDNLSVVPLKTFDTWFVNPHLPSRQGAVGSFVGYTADGKFSSSIKFAIKDALIELAKVKEIEIESEYLIESGTGIFTLSKTKEITSTSVSAKLMDIKIKEKDNKLVVYTWLLENPQQGN